MGFVSDSGIWEVGQKIALGGGLSRAPVAKMRRATSQQAVFLKPNRQII